MSKPPNPFLGATRNEGEEEQPITEIELDHGISAGIILRSMGTGLIPIYEEHAARLERGIDLQTWAQMDVTEKALLVAVRRVRIAERNLQSEAEIAKSEREMKRAKRA